MNKKQARKKVKELYGLLGEICQATLSWYEENDAAGMSNRLLKELTNALNQTTAIVQKRPETIQERAVDKENALAYIQYCLELDKVFIQATGWPPIAKDWPGYKEGMTSEEYLIALEDKLHADLREFEDCILAGMDVPEGNEMLDLEKYSWQFAPSTPVPTGGDDEY